MCNCPIRKSIDQMSRSMFFQRYGVAGLLYHGTIPDLGRRYGKPRMAVGELIEAVARTRINRG